MDSRWFKECSSPEEKELRKKELKSYRNAFEALDKLLDGAEEGILVKYDDPSWSHKQADINGANRKLREIRKLLNTGT